MDNDNKNILLVGTGEVGLTFLVRTIIAKNHQVIVPVEEIRNKLTPVSTLIKLIEDGHLKSDIPSIQSMVIETSELAKLNIDFLTQKDNPPLE